MHILLSLLHKKVYKQQKMYIKQLILKKWIDILYEHINVWESFPFLDTFLSYIFCIGVQYLTTSALEASKTTAVIIGGFTNRRGQEKRSSVEVFTAKPQLEVGLRDVPDTRQMYRCCAL